MSETSDVRLSGPTLKVLKHLLDNPRSERSGLDISKGTKVGPGTIYPLLVRLEKAGWLTSRWEDLDPREAGRPRRRYYRLSATGQQRSREALSEFQLPAGGLAWNL